MSDLQTQVNLLNNYIKTLEGETHSKSTEITTLTEQNNQLIIQCEALRSAKSKTIVTSNSTQVNNLQTTIRKLQSQVKQSKTAYNLLLQQQSKGNQTQKLRQAVHRLEEEKYILQQYKEKLEKQLREIGFKSTDTYVGKMRELEYQIQENLKKIKLYETKIVDYERKVTLLSNQITIKSSEIQRLNDKVKTVTETRTVTVNALSDTKVDQYQKKITQLSNQITISKSQIQRLKQKQSQLVILQRQNESLKRQIQSLNLKITSYSSSSSQTSSLQLTINSLRNDQKQWEREKQQLQIKLADLQTENVEKSNIIGQLRLRQQYLKSKETIESAKDKEVQNLNNIIRVLKIQIEDHKRTISFRDSTIKNLQNKLLSNQSSKSSQITTIQRIVEDKNAEINRLIQIHNQKVTQLTLQIQRFKAISISTSQNTNQLAMLRDQNGFLKRESQNNQLLIQELQREKENLKSRIRDLQDQIGRQRVNVSEVKTYLTTANQSKNQNELISMVKQLRGQLDEVKKSNVVIHEQNYHMQKYLSQLSQSQVHIPMFGNEPSIIRYHSPQNITSIHQQGINSPSQIRYNLQNQSFLKKSKHYHQPYFKSEMNIERKRQQRNDRSGMSPVRDVKSPQNNKQKWESLQRKISALRIQNDELKKTLLYD